MIFLIMRLCVVADVHVARPLIQRYSVVTFMQWMFLFSLLMSLPLSFEDLLHTDYAAIKLPQAQVMVQST